MSTPRLPAPRSSGAPITATSRSAASTLIRRSLPDERVEGVWGNQEVPPHEQEEGGNVGETWFPPRERAEGSRRSYAVHRATAAREEPIRPDEQDDDHRREEKARQVLALVRGEHAAKKPVREA